MYNTDSNYASIKENAITGRYVTHNQIEHYLKKISPHFLVETIGTSVNGISIPIITLGKGPRKILMWSQMHGNESTTTKAVLDLLNFLKEPTTLQTEITVNCTIKIIPILNPDGALAYTRINANGVDLNRDAQEQSQPESKLLWEVFNAFKPNFCFNLHDQRTIFNVGLTNKPATVSFLAPAHNEERTISDSRALSMQLIAGMEAELRQLIPGQIGRFDDSFNPNCVGDAFQMHQIPTVLFEAGHYPEDYEREKTREYIYRAIKTAVEIISSESLHNFKIRDYFSIPENGKLFFDVLIKNAHVINSKYPKGFSVGLLYKEVLKENKIVLQLQVAEVGILDAYFGHKTYDATYENDFNLLRQEHNKFGQLIELYN